MAAQIPFVDQLTNVMESLKSHKRFSLRSLAIVSILVGSVLNFVALLAVFMDRNGGNAPKHLTAWTAVVVRWIPVPCLLLCCVKGVDAILKLFVSFNWNCIDLATHSDRIFRRKHLISATFLVFMDGLGFMSFLTLLIVNGVVVDHMRRGPRILMVYNSVPWMVCWYVLSLIHSNLWFTIGSNDGGSLAALFMALLLVGIFRASLGVWMVGARAVVSVIIRRRGWRRGRRMRTIRV